VRLVDGGAPAERRRVDRLLARRDAARFTALQEPVLVHPCRELLGMIGLLECVLGERVWNRLSRHSE
jgi:hypothetical protein